METSFQGYLAQVDRRRVCVCTHVCVRGREIVELINDVGKAHFYVVSLIVVKHVQSNINWKSVSRIPNLNSFAPCQIYTFCSCAIAVEWRQSTSGAPLRLIIGVKGENSS